MNRTIFLLLFILLTSSSLKSQFIKEYYDEFTGVKEINLVANKLEDDKFLFNAAKITTSKDTLYAIDIYHAGIDDFVYIKSGASLILLIDGTRELVSTDREADRRIIENQTYPVSRELFQRIADAYEVKVRIVAKYNHDTKFTKNTFKGIKLFLKKTE